MKQNEQENHEISNFNFFGLMDKGISIIWLKKKGINIIILFYSLLSYIIGHLVR